MRQIAIGLVDGQLGATRAGQRRVVEYLLPVAWSIGAAAVQLVLHQLPGVFVVLVVGHGVVEARLENRLELAVLHVARNADGDLAYKHNDQEDGELRGMVWISCL